MDQDQLINWVHSHFLYPHCLRSNNIAAFKTGVALAEILTDALPEHYHPLFLPHIQITAISV